MSLFYDKTNEEPKIGVIIFLLLSSAILLVGSLMLWLPAYNRYQKVKDANNQIYVNEKMIAQTKQLVEVETQKAAVKLEEAKGIAAAQKAINETLTDRYLQHEAISAQTTMANSPNHTQIYIPVGTNGIPLVKTVNPE